MRLLWLVAGLGCQGVLVYAHAGAVDVEVADVNERGLELGHSKQRGAAKGVVFYLYTILDIFSRKVVGWALTEHESARTAHD